MQKIDELKIRFQKYRLQILLALIGITLIIGGLTFQKVINLNSTKIEVLSSSSPNETKPNDIVVEIGGQVLKPGVYHLPVSARIEDAFIVSGGITANADRGWVEKNINRAARLSDGQKIYIPEHSEVLSASNLSSFSNVAQYGSSQSPSQININMGSLTDLDTLPGIGQVYAQKIIDNRPYSNINELVSKKVIPQTTFDKIKDKILAN